MKAILSASSSSDALAIIVALLALSYAMYQMAMIAIEKVFKRDIEPRIKALEQSVDALRGEKKRWVSDKS
jgi:hypothetical protein